MGMRVGTLSVWVGVACSHVRGGGQPRGLTDRAVCVCIRVQGKKFHMGNGV